MVHAYVLGTEYIALYNKFWLLRLEKLSSQKKADKKKGLLQRGWGGGQGSVQQESAAGASAGVDPFREVRRTTSSGGGGAGTRPTHK